jgi:hypothetical protein
MDWNPPYGALKPVRRVLLVSAEQSVGFFYSNIINKSAQRRAATFASRAPPRAIPERSRLGWVVRLLRPSRGT